MDALATSAARLQTVKYFNVCSLAVLTYDYLLTLGMEVEYIWKAKWGIGKVLFLLARYPTFIDVPLMLYYALTPGLSSDHDTCIRLYSVASWATVFGIGVAEAILVLRTHALWGNQRRVLVPLMTLYVTIYISVVVILVFFLRSLRSNQGELSDGAPPLPTVVGCHPVAGSNILFGDFALLMVFETVVMILTIWVGIQRFRHSQSLFIITLYRDGIFYFIYMFLISLGNIVVLVAGPPEYVDLLNTLQRVMHSVLSTRILLHVRASARGSDMIFPLSPLSRIQFGSHFTDEVPESTTMNDTRQVSTHAQSETLTEL